MNKKIVIIVSALLYAMPIKAQISGAAGSFVRMGYGATGIGLGNAGVAVTEENESNPFYNPSTLGYRETSKVGVVYTYLPFDRLLNFAYGYFALGNYAGLGVSFINSGVTNIDFRDASGQVTDPNGFTSENVLILSFGHKLSVGVDFIDNLSVGLSTRFYLAKQIPSLPVSFSFGFDFGLGYRIPLTEDDSSHVLNIGASLSDLNSRWEWVSSSYNARDNFPLSFKWGMSYQVKNILYMKSILLSVENEWLWLNDNNDTYKEVFLKIGLMVEPIKYIRVRIGVDQLSLAYVSVDDLLKWSVGVSAYIPIGDKYLDFSYTLVYERYAPFGMSVISIGYAF